MKQEDIAIALTNELISIRPLKGIEKFIVQRTIENNTSFKAYKTYTVILWYVKGKKTHKLITIEKVERVLTGEEDKINKILNIEFLNLIFKLLKSDVWEQIIKEEYGISNNE